MFYPIDNNLWLYLLDMAIIEALAIYTWRFRRYPGAVPYIARQACKGAWLLFLVLADMSRELPAKQFWIALEQMMAVCSPYLWLLFVWQLSQEKKSLPPIVRYIFPGIIACLWLAVLSNSWHGLYWKRIWLEDQTIRFVPGPVGWLALINSYLLCVLSTILSIRWILATAGLRRRQALWFTLPGLFPWAGHILGRIPACHFFAPQALGFLLSGIFITWAYYRWRVYSILPTARETAAKNMIDGLLVIDEQGYLAAINPAAQKMLRGLPAVPGAKFQDLTAAWPALTVLDRAPSGDVLEAVRETADTRRCYRLKRIPLSTPAGRLGQILLLTDITRQKEDQAQMLEQQKALSILAERNRLGREIHDTQGQFPAYVKTQAQAIRLLLQKQRPEEAVKQLEALIQAADATFTAVRKNIAELETDATDWDFFTSLREWLSQFQILSDPSLVIVYSGPNSPPIRWISPKAQVQLLRIIQECLTNIRKHSGADKVVLDFSVTADCLKVTITDDGCGFTAEKLRPSPAKFGLRIIRERAADAGGTCWIQSSPGKGTIITVGIPLLTIADTTGKDDNVESFAR